jgi:hypothetical protein
MRVHEARLMPEAQVVPPTSFKHYLDRNAAAVNVITDKVVMCT